MYETEDHIECFVADNLFSKQNCNYCLSKYCLNRAIACFTASTNVIFLTISLDSDGDFISFSSDDELVEILTQMTATRADPMQVVCWSTWSWKRKNKKENKKSSKTKNKKKKKTKKKKTIKTVRRLRKKEKKERRRGRNSKTTTTTTTITTTPKQQQQPQQRQHLF